MSNTFKNMFSERERALEYEFFHKIDQELLKDLSQTLAKDKLKSTLSTSGHIHDESLLDELVEIGVRPESLAAVNLIPLIVVAWADRRVADKERLTVAHAAVAEGIELGSPAYHLLDHWLRVEPSENFGQVWAHYVRSLAKTLPADALEALRSRIMSRASTVAKAAHGMLGFGRLSSEEKSLLDELDQCFCG